MKPLVPCEFVRASHRSFAQEVNYFLQLLSSYGSLICEGNILSVNSENCNVVEPRYVLFRRYSISIWMKRHDILLRILVEFTLVLQRSHGWVRIMKRATFQPTFFTFKNKRRLMIRLSVGLYNRLCPFVCLILPPPPDFWGFLGFCLSVYPH
jgi:hypothetical protein